MACINEQLTVKYVINYKISAVIEQNIQCDKSKPIMTRLLQGQ